MKFTRRDFIHTGCAITAATLIPNSLEAAFHGSLTGNPNRTVLNVGPNAWANLVKGLGFNAPPSVADANGYPTGTTTADISNNAQLVVGYYGDYVLKWTGTGSFSLTACALLVRSTSSAGIITGVAGTSGDTFGNLVISTQANPRMVFSFGAVIQGMAASPTSNGAGGNYIRVAFKTNAVLSFAGRGGINQLKLQNSSLNGNLVGQLNAIDTWNWIDVGDGIHVDLTTSVTTGAVSAFNAGSPYVSGGEVINTATNLSLHLPAATYTSFNNFVICLSGNETAVDSGQMWDPTLVSQYQYLMNSASAPASQKGWLRFMDSSGVQSSYECDFANRIPASYISYTSTGALNYFPPAYQAGAITNTSDALTCSDPIQTVWSGTAYLDSAIVQGTISAANTTANPTLNVGGHGPKPIFDFTTNPFIFAFSAPPPSPGTDVLQFTFSATWLNGGTPLVFNYSTVVGDTSVAALNGNLVNALIANSTLATGKILFGNSGQVTAYARTAEAGVLTITYTSGPAICTMTRIPSGKLLSGLGTFIYSKFLDGWIYRANGLTCSIPTESIVQLCNQVGAHFWYNFPTYTKAQFITDFTNFMGDSITGLTSGLRLGTEVGNELWNFSQGPYGRCLYLAAGVGIYPGGNDSQQWSWGALRSIQYGALASAAWTGKGRSASDYYIINMGNQPSAFPNQSYQKYVLEGFALTTSNAVYAAWSGLAGGLAPADYSVSGNRPADKYLTATGMATYWYGDYIRETSGEIFGSVTDNATWLQASLDYTNGNTSSAFAALTSLFTVSRGSAPIASGSYNNSTGALTLTLSSVINTGTANVSDVCYLTNLTGTGAFATIDLKTGNGFSAISPTSGTTITLNVGAGKGSMTITGGVLIDRTASTINPGQASNWAIFNSVYFPNFETNVETYDTTRATNGLSKLALFNYEGAPQWSVGNSALNGTNSTTDTAPLISQMTTLTWNVNAYDALGGTGSTAITHVAQQVLNMVQGWKLDIDHTGAAANTGSYKNMIKTYYYQGLVNASAGKGREVHPAQFGYQANIWGLFPVSHTLGGQYTNYDAIHEWNT